MGLRKQAPVARKRYHKILKTQKLPLLGHICHFWRERLPRLGTTAEDHRLREEFAASDAFKEYEDQVREEARQFMLRAASRDDLVFAPDVQASQSMSHTMVCVLLCHGYDLQSVAPPHPVHRTSNPPASTAATVLASQSMPHMMVCVFLCHGCDLQSVAPPPNVQRTFPISSRPPPSQTAAPTSTPSIPVCDLFSHCLSLFLGALITR